MISTGHRSEGAAEPGRDAGESEESPDFGGVCRLSGVVTRGFGRGRELGFPTANLDLSHGPQIPGNGIYAAWAHLPDCKYMAAVSVGVNPTFEERVQAVEAYLLDFDRDIYGETLHLEFVAKLRDEVEYEGIGPLIAQIQRDVDQTRAVLTGSGASTEVGEHAG